jgi:predicted hotdog family 3-hydroxylacyl-ACP dehydratase
MVLNRDAIAALIPHQGAMCLLEEVLSTNDAGIVCRAVSHRDSGHPLREDGILPAVCGIEYAAQAMAVHGASSGRPQGTARQTRHAGGRAGCRLHVERLDDMRTISSFPRCMLVAEEGGSSTSSFSSAGAKELVRGRAAVSLAAGGTAVSRVAVVIPAYNEAGHDTGHCATHAASESVAHRRGRRLRPTARRDTLRPAAHPAAQPGESRPGKRA